MTKLTKNITSQPLPSSRNELLEEINLLREQMYLAYHKIESLHDPLIVAISQQMDELLNEWNRLYVS